jgi:hypothetical protein
MRQQLGFQSLGVQIAKMELFCTDVETELS